VVGAVGAPKDASSAPVPGEGIRKCPGRRARIVQNIENLSPELHFELLTFLDFGLNSEKSRVAEDRYMEQYPPSSQYTVARKAKRWVL
jgi:hypothetical protein